jgi:hypothetical protein
MRQKMFHQTWLFSPPHLGYIPARRRHILHQTQERKTARNKLLKKGKKKKKQQREKQEVKRGHFISISKGKKEMIPPPPYQQVLSFILDCVIYSPSSMSFAGR